MNSFALILTFVFLFSYQIFGQEVLYQRPDNNISFELASDENNTYRANINSYSIVISKFDQEMSFRDALAIYPENNFTFTDSRGKTHLLTNFNGFKDIAISKNKLHLIFETVSNKKAQAFIIDLQVDLEKFEANNKLNTLYEIKAKRKIDLEYTQGAKVEYKSYEDSIIKMIYQVPNKFKDDFKFGIIQFKINDELTMVKDEKISLMPGIKRSFFGVEDFIIDSADNIICSGTKISNTNYSNSNLMFFYRNHEKNSFQKIHLTLDNRDIISYKMFVNNDKAIIFGLCKKQDDKLSEAEAKESFLAYANDGKLRNPKIRYFDNNKITEDGLDYYKKLKSVTLIDDSYYLLFQYFAESENKSSSTYSWLTYSDYFVKDFNIVKFNEKLNEEWSITIPYSAHYNNSDYQNFTRCKLVKGNDGSIVAIYNDAYKNSHKKLTDENLEEADFTVKIPVISSFRSTLNLVPTIDRNSQINRKPVSDTAYNEYTVSFVRINEQSGDLDKIFYNQRKLHSLIYNLAIPGYADKKLIYMPYYIYGKFGICTVNINNI